MIDYEWDRSPKPSPANLSFMGKFTSVLYKLWAVILVCSIPIAILRLSHPSPVWIWAGYAALGLLLLGAICIMLLPRDRN